MVLVLSPVTVRLTVNKFLRGNLEARLLKAGIHPPIGL